MGTLSGSMVYQASDLEDYTEILANLEVNECVANIVSDEGLLRITFDFN